MALDRLPTGVRERLGLLAFALGVALAGAFRLVLALTPDAVVAASIVLLGELGDKIALAAALALAVGALTAAVVVGLLAGRRAERLSVAVATASVLVVLVTLAFSGASRAGIGASLVAGGCAGLALAVGASVAGLGWRSDGAVATDRRAALGSLATALGIGLLGAVLRRPTPDDGQTPAEADLELSSTEREVIDAALSTAADRSLDVDGLEPLVSDSFYEVDINQLNPTVDRESWALTVTGAVDSELSLSFADLRERPTEHQFVTLRCVGESLNGYKMDNALWTGLSVSGLLDEAGPNGRYVVLRATDDYFEEFPLSALRRGFLAYGMNGEALPRRHGYPVRALIPGHWGEINVKWLDEIEVRDEPLKGYWERRGWHGTGPVNTVAKLHARTRDGDRVRVAGHAYAGTRGIDRVEVSTDGGDSWAEATLSEPLPGEDVWRQWTYAYPSPGRKHEVVVRAVDGTGTVQPRTRADAFPSGASGWVSVRVDPSNLG
ncbi:MAG: molybdopterin-dependent oxidoreductase [Haloferacaceae archaeon]